ncbi:unnamed protein product [Brachionus calyciflorus]|uniref:Uncharacterized protein n=1 Tax=Brachionus calyciflorus TaxID=104777 RepID=A0A814AHH2_9BILA|nr:unnamed protein product [Brachionus calyciflorus]
MPPKSKFSRSRTNNLVVFCQKIIIEVKIDEEMEVDVQSDINNNNQEFLFSSGSETDESDSDVFFPEEEMVSIDISLISQLLEFIQSSKPPKRWISVLIYCVLRQFNISFSNIDLFLSQLNLLTSSSSSQQ